VLSACAYAGSGIPSAKPVLVPVCHAMLDAVNTSYQMPSLPASVEEARHCKVVASSYACDRDPCPFQKTGQAPIPTSV